MDRSTIRGKSDAVVAPLGERERYTNELVNIMTTTYRIDRNEAYSIVGYLKDAYGLLRRNKQLLASALVLLYVNEGAVDYDSFSTFYQENESLIRKKTTVETEKYMYSLYRYVKYASLYYSG